LTGELRRDSAFTGDAHVFHASSTSAESAALKLGDGSFSRYIKSLKLGKMMKYEYVPEFQNALYAPRPLKAVSAEK
jgi:hypothetical protein